MFMFLKSSSISSLILMLYSVVIFPITIYFIMYQDHLMLEWYIFSVSSCSVCFTILFDSVSLSFSNVVCFISSCVMMFSSSYMSHDPFLKRFTWLVMLFVLSMNLLVFIPSLPALLLGWDGLGIVSFALVIYYQNMKSLGAGMITVLANRIGDVMILISIGLMVLQGHWIITQMWDFYLSFWVILAILLAAMTKSAQIPFSSWLPAAMAAPTPVSALVHSSTLVTAGVFLLIRFSPFLNTTAMFKSVLLFLSVLTLLMAGIGANYENDLKKIIALSTLSQLGVMMLSLSLGSMELALFHLYTHALFKALLFLCAGMIIHNMNNTQDIRSMGLIYFQAPLTTMSMNIANLALCGAPFLSGFYSKDLILELSTYSSMSLAMTMMIFIATGMTAAYSFRLSFCSLWSVVKDNAFHSKQEFDMHINSSTMMLTVVAISAGMFMQSVYLFFDPMPFTLPQHLKLMSVIAILSGLYLGLNMWESGFNDNYTNKMKYFFSTMWFLTPLSSQPLTKFSMLLGTNLMKSIDLGWLEVTGGQGALYLTSNTSLLNQKVQMKSYNYFIFLMIMTIMVLSILYTL
uniref:NADH-ubiquinone oxidoreductase chain 5 n=1 Tax=Cymbium olla TaxID=543401 RepID=C8XQU5_CYMOL|nr:NADH dehydrogenase subunit 5 [Cymbium olla]ACF04876.1 NADH dehydrogenase subunit 5 [Cymbium olla]